MYYIIYSGHICCQYMVVKQCIVVHLACQIFILQGSIVFLLEQKDSTVTVWHSTAQVDTAYEELIHRYCERLNSIQHHLFPPYQLIKVSHRDWRTMDLLLLNTSTPLTELMGNYALISCKGNRKRRPLIVLSGPNVS